METKHLVAEIKSAKDSGSFEAILSMPTQDRDGEIIDAGAFLPLPKRITIDVDHGLSAEKTIGSGEPFYDGDTLMIRGTFASTPLAQTIRTLVKEGHVGHMSVAYRAAQYEIDETDGLPHLRKGELLNAGIVAIPSNREAEILAVKEAKVGARNSAKDLERIQGTHDHMVELGAQCGEKCAHVTDSKGLLTSADIGRIVAPDNSADTEPPDTADEQSAVSGAEVEVARAHAELEAALAELALG